MARRKKRKSSARPEADQSQGPERAGKRQLRARAREADPAALKPRRDTFIAGMFFALLIGLFLGSLIPGLFEKGREKAQAPAPADVPAPSVDWREALPSQLRQRLAQLEKESRDSPGDAAVWTALGNLYFDAGHPGEAIDAYGRSLGIQPDNPDVLSDLGILYRETGQPEQALDAFRKASELDPRHQNSIFNQGVVLYFDLGRRPEALEKWRALLEMNPDAVAPDGKRLEEMIGRLESQSGQSGR